MRTKRVAKPIVMGMDLSMTSTGIVVFGADWKPSDPWKDVLRFKAGYDLKDPSHAELVERLSEIADVVARALVQTQATHVFIEDYAWGMAHGAQRLGEIGGIAKVACFDTAGVAPEPVNSASWRKHLVGYGGTPKGFPRGWIKKECHRILRRDVKAPDDWNGDELDAFGVTNFGRSVLGLPSLALTLKKG